MAHNNSTDQNQRPRTGQRRSRLLRISVLVVALAGCSLRNLDDLHQGSGSSAGGTTVSAGGGTSTGTVPSTGTGAGAGTAARADGGSAGSGGVAAAGTASTADPTSATGGTTTSGTGAGGTSPTAGGASGTTGPIDCPAHNGSGGTLITPPSNDFELGMDRWARMSGSLGVSRVEGDATACNGTAYLTCGAGRQGGWDGPVIDVLPYMVPGHSYVFSVAARFNSATVPASGRSIGITTVTGCDDNNAVYTPLRKLITTSNWVRLQSDPTRPIVFPPVGCQIVGLAAVYVETDDADANLAIDIDDFRLIDMTEPSTGAGGAGGAGGLPEAGAAGFAGSGT